MADFAPSDYQKREKEERERVDKYKRGKEEALF